MMCSQPGQITILIDGRNISVAGGGTVLDAATQAGIEIPTLCFLRGYEPSTSCQVCLVKDCATQRFVPACATTATDGMMLESESDEVRQVRRTALELLLSDHVGDCLAPCFFACPAHMDIPLMLKQIGEEDVRQAIATIKRDIALPAALGRVCSKPCEKGCRRLASDDAVAVCELKRYVADADLQSPRPYLPDCQPNTGKRVAIVGAGSTGLSAAYYLRQRGHQCVLLERDSAAGGRLRGSAELPGEVLDAEIAQILRLGVPLRCDHPLTDAEAFAALRRDFDAVLLACGQVASPQVRQWGLPASKRGIAVNRDTFQTELPDVFAAGNAVRGHALVVRSGADGKEVAETISQFLAGEAVRGPAKPFSSRMGRVSTEEVEAMVDGAGHVPRAAPATTADYSLPQAAAQSHRCLACGCEAHGNCKLERYAVLYGADASRFAGERRPYELIGRDCAVVFEPGKCIKCELCVQIAARAREPLGLTFTGRGFDVRLQVPFDETMDAALSKVAAECVAACPTAALRFKSR